MIYWKFIFVSVNIELSNGMWKNFGCASYLRSCCLVNFEQYSFRSVSDVPCVRQFALKLSMNSVSSVMQYFVVCRSVSEISFCAYPINPFMNVSGQFRGFFTRIWIKDSKGHSKLFISIIETNVFFSLWYEGVVEFNIILPCANLLLHSYAVSEYVRILCSKGLEFNVWSPKTGNNQEYGGSGFVEGSQKISDFFL